ncbi:MAG: TatD family hydrolase [Gammaproteobacteria bacterium]
MWIDSHCHLQLLDCNNTSLEQVIESAKEKGVSRLLTVSTELEHEVLLKIINLKPEFQEFIDISVGLHPNHEVEQEPIEEELLNAANQRAVVALGETGLDYYRNNVSKDSQIERFYKHVSVAKQLNKALIIHTREAAADTLFHLKSYEADKTGGVIHCFTESLDFARKALDLNFYISFSGIVTFKNAENLREVAKYVPKDRILIETDAPYLAPVPMRGKQNLPEYVVHVGQYLADLLNIRFEEFALISSENYKDCFLRNSEFQRKS